MKLKYFFLTGILCFITIFQSYGQTSGTDFSVKVSFSEDIRSSVSEDGRLFLFFSQNPSVEPRTQTWPNPRSRTQIFAKNISGLRVEEGLELDNSLEWISTADWTLQNIPEGEYYVQVLWDQDVSESRMDAPGNLYSTKQKVTIGAQSEMKVVINQTIPERKIVDNELVRVVDFQSDTLSKWWRKPVYLKASILLPSGYNSSKGDYAIRYNVAGYGGRYDRINYLLRNKPFMDWWNSEDAPQVINVFLDGEGPFGDSYQMDSENSGPYGYALMNELIPYIESKYRGTDTPKTRFVDGCSTGGWVSLGLQLYYPDHFNGVFSYSPDAIEFENYQLINIYKDENAFINEAGYLRPVMRDVSGEPLLSLKDFIQYENVQGSSNTYLNSGGQFSAHTALYSPKGANGLPQPLFDPATGVIDHEVAEYWKKYDFKLYAQKNWQSLGPKLVGKIFIWMGDMDNFYLNPATRKFAEFMQDTQNPKSDAEIVFTPMKGHCAEFSHREVLEKIQEKLKSMK